MRTLIAYYSRTGNSAKAAERLAAELGADIEEVNPKRGYGGPFGFLRGCAQGVLGKKAEIENPVRNPAEYDLVVLVTPIWAGGMAAPIAGYLSCAGSEIPLFAYLETRAGADGTSISQNVGKIKILTAADCVASCSLVPGSEEYDSKLAGFIADLKALSGPEVEESAEEKIEEKVEEEVEEKVETSDVAEPATNIVPFEVDGEDADIDEFDTVFPPDEVEDGEGNIDPEDAPEV